MSKGRNVGGAPMMIRRPLQSMQTQAPIDLRTDDDDGDDMQAPQASTASHPAAQVPTSHPAVSSAGLRTVAPAVPETRSTRPQAPDAERDAQLSSATPATDLALSPASATTALSLLQIPPPPSKSLRNRVGTLNAPYTRRDGKSTVKLQAAISVETDALLRRHAARLPKHIKYNDFVDMIVRDGIAKFERDLQEAASADLQMRRATKLE